MAKRRKFPVLSAGAEYLVMGALMRRNIQTCKAFECNANYDLICVNPENIGKKLDSCVRIQVKSRAQRDNDGGFFVPINDGQPCFDGFDYLVAVFLNVAYWGDGKYRGFNSEGIDDEVEMYVFPSDVLKKNKNWFSGKRLRLNKKIAGEIEQYRNWKGIEKIAKRLRVPEIPTKGKALIKSKKKGK